MVARSRGGKQTPPSWKLSGLACWLVALVAFDALMLLLASGVRSGGNDAAGNGMANAFRELVIQAGVVLVGCLTLLFLVIRHRKARVGILVALVLVTSLLPMLLQ